MISFAQFVIFLAIDCYFNLKTADLGHNKANKPTRKHKAHETVKRKSLVGIKLILSKR